MDYYYFIEDMPLMPPFHDIRFSDWSNVFNVHVDRLSVLLTVSHSFNGQLLQFGKFENTDFEQAIQISLRDFSLIPRLQEEQKNMPVICCKKKKKHMFSPVVNVACIADALNLLYRASPKLPGPE